MRTILLVLGVLLLSSIPVHRSKITKDCECKGIKLWGDVEVVKFGADFKVEVVEIGADLNVEIHNFPYRCGQWRFVEAFSDFTVEFVEMGADFTIRYGDFPGLNTNVIR